MKLTILSDRTFHLTPAMLIQIQDAAPELEVVYHPASTATAAHMAHTRVLFGCPNINLLHEAPHLMWHHLPNAGIGDYNRADLYVNPHVQVTNARGVYGEPIAEHVVAQVFALARCMPLYARQQFGQVWQRDDEACVSVRGSTVAVFGLGDLGSHVAQSLHALGAEVLGVRRTLIDKPKCVRALYDLRSMKQVTAVADFVICCLPLTPATTRLFDEEVFAGMHPRSFFINVGRGAIVDTTALVRALSVEWIAGAALDVTDPEPLPKGHPLWTLSNVIITPHASAVANDIQERKLSQFLELLALFQAGRRMKNLISFLHGY